MSGFKTVFKKRLDECKELSEYNEEFRITFEQWTLIYDCLTSDNGNC